LAITAAGEKLKLILIFKVIGVNKLINYKNYVLKKNQNAWMTKSLYVEYLNSVIKPFVLQQRLKADLMLKKHCSLLIILADIILI